TPGVAAEVAVPPEPYVTTTVWPAVRVTPVTVIVCPDTDSTPTEDVVKPGPAEVAGGVHPAGTATVSEPDDIPPAAAVYVSVTVRPAWFAETTVIDETAEPAPSAA